MSARSRNAFGTALGTSIVLALCMGWAVFKIGMVHDESASNLIVAPAITFVGGLAVIFPLAYFFPPKGNQGIANDRARWLVWGIVGLFALMIAISYLVK